jgi:glycosyltransferase involved in cell wall biosynthesis
MHEKLITFAVPCYNSAAYMRHCVESLLTAGDDAEIILVDDGSTKDETPAICDEYAERYPNIVRAIHQENGGHGEGVNQGLRNARGLYYKVVDSDDWLDEEALRQVMDRLRALAEQGNAPDMMVTNFVYEHVEDQTQHTMRFANVFPQEKIFTWKDMGHFRPDQHLMMHAVIYRTEVLRKAGVELPKHTFYVDNIVVYQPMPCVQTIYYMDVGLYRYFIGRADQSVNEKVWLTHTDDQLRVTRHLISCQNLRELPPEQKRLRAYMMQYLSNMMAASDIMLIMNGGEESRNAKAELWQYLREHTDAAIYRTICLSVGGLTNIKGTPGEKLALLGYRLSRKLLKFN